MRFRSALGGWPTGYVPTGPFRLNHNSPQAKGLVAWWSSLAVPDSDSQQDLMRGLAFTENGTPEWRNYGDRGPGLFLDSGSNEYIETTDLASQPDVPCSIVAWVRLDNPNLWTTYDITTRADPDVGFARGVGLRIVVRGAATTIWPTYLLNAANTTPGDTTIVSGDLLMLAGVTYSDTDHRLFFQGTQRSSSVALEVWPGCDVFSIGVNNIDNAYNNPWNGPIYDVRIYNRGLPVAEVAEQYFNPWGLYLPVQRARAIMSPTPTVPRRIFITHW